MKKVKLFEDFLKEASGLDHLPANPAAATATGGFLKIFIQDVEYAYRAEYAKKFAKTRSEKELSFMKSLECAKTPNKAFKGQLKEVEKMISFNEREIKKQGIEIKKVIEDSKELKKDPNTKKAMAMAEELSQNIGIDGAGKPNKIKYRYDYVWKTWDLTPSDKLACDKFIADIFKEWEAEAAKAEKMDAKFSKYVDTIELASYINEKVNIKKEIKKVADYFDDTEPSDTEIYVKDYVEDGDVSSYGYMFWWNAEDQECGIEYQNTAGSDESDDPCKTADDFIAYVNSRI